MRFLRFFPLSLTAWCLPLIARAVNTEGFLDDTGAAADYAPVASRPLPAIIGDIINIFLSVIGILMVVLMVYGGYLWMTARGEEERVTQAKDTIRNAIIGLTIVLLAFAISAFVVNAMVEATTGTPQ